MSSDHEPQKRKPTEADSAPQAEMEEQPLQSTRSHAEILYLQRTLGNRAVTQRLKPASQPQQIQREGFGEWILSWFSSKPEKPAQGGAGPNGAAAAPPQPQPPAAVNGPAPAAAPAANGPAPAVPQQPAQAAGAGADAPLPKNAEKRARQKARAAAKTASQAALRAAFNPAPAAAPAAGPAGPARPALTPQQQAANLWAYKQSDWANQCDQVMSIYNAGAKALPNHGDHMVTQESVTRCLPEIQDGSSWRQGRPDNSSANVRVYVEVDREGCRFADSVIAISDGLSHQTTRDSGNYWVYKRTGNKAFAHHDGKKHTNDVG